jgi:hypothetical protein
MICCMIIIPLMEIDRNGKAYSLAPTDSTGHENALFQFDQFPNLFSNTIFTLTMHAILTGLLTPVKPDKLVRPVVKYGFIASGIIYVILSILGVLAFGTGLYYENSPGNLKFYHFNFKDHYPVAFYIVSFYFFLLISIFPMITIAVRNSLIYILLP